MQPASYSILKTLAYFDIFNYPLTQREIILFMDAVYHRDEIEENIQYLVEEKMIFPLGEYYSLNNDVSLAQRRKAGNKKAIKQIRIAKRLAGFLSRFPYVRAVAVSGSLSKNFADEHSDIDFFILTKANRLWIARTIMHLFKKLTYLAGKQHWFCMNYYLDETALEIPEKNIYTATEVITALQLYGEATFKNFIQTNHWAFDFYPAYSSDYDKPQKIRKGLLKRTIEFLFDNRIGERLDSWLMKVTVKRWEKKTELFQKNKKGLVMGMDGGKHFSKANPASFQNQVLHRYNDNLNRIYQKLHNIPSAKAI